MEAQGRGAAGSRNPGPPNGHPRGIECVRIFYHVSIVFISPPGEEFCVLSVYSACFVRVFVLFIDDTYCIYSAFSVVHARKHMLAASVVTCDRRK